MIHLSTDRWRGGSISQHSCDVFASRHGDLVLEEKVWELPSCLRFMEKSTAILIIIGTAQEHVRQTEKL